MFCTNIAGQLMEKKNFYAPLRIISLHFMCPDPKNTIKAGVSTAFEQKVGVDWVTG